MNEKDSYGAGLDFTSYLVLAADQYPDMAPIYVASNVTLGASYLHCTVAAVLIGALALIE